MEYIGPIELVEKQTGHLFSAPYGNSIVTTKDLQFGRIVHSGVTQTRRCLVPIISAEWLIPLKSQAIYMAALTSSLSEIVLE